MHRVDKTDAGIIPEKPDFVAGKPSDTPFFGVLACVQHQADGVGVEGVIASLNTKGARLARLPTNESSKLFVVLGGNNLVGVEHENPVPGCLGKRRIPGY